MASKSPKHVTHCVRLKPTDHARLQRYATHAGMLKGEWIREVLALRAQQVLAGDDLSELACLTAQGSGVVFCIRFTVEEYRRIRLAAQKEGMLLSTWIRCTTLEYMANHSAAA